MFSHIHIPLITGNAAIELHYMCNVTTLLGTTNPNPKPMKYDQTK